MSNTIIKFFKGFADGNFPVSKQAERAVFQQNVEKLFAAGCDLMQIASDSNYTPNPQYGNLVFWEDDNNEQHAGIIIANREVYSITQQRKLAQIPAGAKGWDGLKELLKPNWQPQEDPDPDKYGTAYYLEDQNGSYLDAYYFPIVQGKYATIYWAGIFKFYSIDSNNALEFEHGIGSDGVLIKANYPPLNKNVRIKELAKTELLQIGELGFVYSPTVIESYKSSHQFIKKHDISHIFKLDYTLGMALITLVEDISKLPTAAQPFNEASVEHGLLQVLLPSGENYVLRLGSAIPGPEGKQPAVIATQFAVEEESALFEIEKKAPINIWQSASIWLNGVLIEKSGKPQFVYQRFKVAIDAGIVGFDDEHHEYYFSTPPVDAIKVYENRTSLITALLAAEFTVIGEYIYLRRILASFYDGSEESQKVVKNFVHTHPDNGANTKISPSTTDLHQRGLYQKTKDYTQILYNATQKAVLFFAPKSMNDENARIDNDAFYKSVGLQNRPDGSAVIAMSYAEFIKLFAV